MNPDPTAEIKAIRHRLGAELNFEIDRIIADIQRRQKSSGQAYVRLSKQQPRLTPRDTEAGKSVDFVMPSPPCEH